MDIGTIVFFCLVFGGITAAIANAKNLPVGQSFVLGALLGFIGLIIVACQKPGLPKAPHGMRAVKCLRCNTIQNIPAGQPVLECWQCRVAYQLWVPPQSPIARPIPVASSTTQLSPTSKVRCHYCRHVQTVPSTAAIFICEQCGTRLKRRATPATDHSPS